MTKNIVFSYILTAHRGLIFTLCLLVILAHPTISRAHSLSEKMQYSDLSGMILKTALQLNMLKEFSLIAAYSSDIRFSPQGGEITGEYQVWNGVVAWASAGFFPREFLLTAGGGHQRIITWDGGAWGLTAGAGRSYLSDFISTGRRKQVSLTQWQAEISAMAKWAYAWDAQMAFIRYYYNLRLSPELVEQYQDLLQDRETLSLGFSDFALYILSASIGYDWAWLGYTALTLDMTVNWDNSRVFSGQVQWEKEIFDPLTLGLACQVSSKKDILASLTVAYLF